VFLDRDGTLIEERGFLRDPNELRLIDGAAESILRLNNKGLITCIISNQSGVARGLMNEEDVRGMHRKLLEELKKEGANVERIYYCPHHPSGTVEPYNRDCECRKPKPGMMRTAERELSVDLSRSYVVGDKLADIQAGHAVEATTILVLTGYGERSREIAEREGITADYIAPSIREAIKFVVQNIDENEDKNG
jgi:D-glycero-D-manno-heptose 1,7-bisphosphate phosphatase